MAVAQDTTRRLDVGDVAPNLALVRADTGESMPLARLWQEDPAVLVFLRHLGCTFCKEHVAQLRHDADAFVDRNTTIGLVTVCDAATTSVFCAESGLDNPFVGLSDPDKRAFSAFGLSRGTGAEIFSPRVLRRGFQAALHGYLAGVPKGDPLQMPGVFIIDRGGVIRYAHRNEDIADNPRNADLFAILASLS